MTVAPTATGAAASSPTKARRTAYEDDRSAGQVRHLERLWLETGVLASRPAHFANPSHWEGRRSASCLDVGSPPA